MGSYNNGVVFKGRLEWEVYGSENVGIYREGFLGEGMS